MEKIRNLLIKKPTNERKGDIYLWKWLGILFSIIMIITGCQQDPMKQILTETHTEIDWVDFIKWDGEEYLGVHTGVLSNESFVDVKIGEVQFKVADNVSNPSYRLKDGDAAFHEPGTELFSIKGEKKLMAVKSPYSINGYQLYYLNDGEGYKWNFKDLPLELVNKVEIYLDNTLVNEIDDIKSFLEILRKGTLQTTFQPNTNYQDPIYYEMVFYAEGPVAHQYTLFFDGETYYWHPWDTEILSDEIGTFLK